VPATESFTSCGTRTPRKELLNIEKFTSADFGDDGSAVREANIGRKYGFSHFMDQQVPVASSECKNLAFHRDAITMAMRPLPQVPSGMGANSTTMAEDGFSIRVIYSYNPNYLGVQVTLDLLYGVAELRDEFAVVIRSTEV
jgi:P22 coat protein - gene protein 5.